ncbi:MAG: zinc-binding dehydrogenase, partial [Alphaproteobacteria bacterium]|nr:zinc-binding dehydrogenase [Alphaproteobacteria bacterium]
MLGCMLSCPLSCANKILCELFPPFLPPTLPPLPMHAILHQPPPPPTALDDVPLTWGEQPTPKPAAGEVLIQVAAAGVNQPDLLQRRGLYPPPARHSAILGLEVAGTVVQLGADVRDVQVGDVVCALTNGGGYAEYVSVPAGQCLPIPAGLSLIQAAALPEALFTLWAHLFLRANLRGGERLLVHGAAGGVGHLAIQLAKAFGVGVLALVGTKPKAAFVRKLGVEKVLPEWRQQNWPAWVKEMTQGEGVSVVLDHHGGSLM